MRMLRRLAERLRRRSSFRDGRICAITLSIAVLSLLALMPAAGAYFVPLGRLAAGRRHLSLEFDRPAEGNAQIDDDHMQTVADERLCRDMAKTVELDATTTATYFLHLKSGAAILSRIAFR